MCDYAEQIERLRECASSNHEVHLKCGAYLSGVCAKTRDVRMNDAADAIEELLVFAYAVAKMAVNAEEDDVSAEVLCRKLYKLGIIEKDGAWWWLPEPPKEPADE